MTFMQAKDETLKWIIPGMLSYLCYEVNYLGKAMIDVKRGSEFTSYRVDQHRDAIKGIQAHSIDVDVIIGQLKLICLEKRK